VCVLYVSAAPALAPTYRERRIPDGDPQAYLDDRRDRLLASVIRDHRRLEGRTPAFGVVYPAGSRRSARYQITPAKQ
jgi:hypothetical protein